MVQLKINEKLADALRFIIKADSEMRSFTAEEKERKLQRLDLNSLEEIDEMMTDLICAITNVAGNVLAYELIEEDKRER